MNMSGVISSIGSQLGINNISLPFVDPITGDETSAENVLLNVITTTTIPIYSQFVPWVRVGDINLGNLKLVDRNSNIYMLPQFLTTTEVMYVIDVSLPHINTRGTYGDISPAYGISRSVEGVINSMEYMMVAGQMRAEPTWDYLGYNKIRLYGYPKCMLTFKVACCHEPNGETIEESCRDSFTELAVLDIKEYLYNNLKYYEEIPSAFGNLKLRTEDLQSATGDKNTLLDRWRDTFHLDITDYMEWM